MAAQQGAGYLHPGPETPKFRVAGFIITAVLQATLAGCGGGGGSAATGTQSNDNPAPPLHFGEKDDLCKGLVIDKAARPMTALEKPGLRQSVSDPQFGTRITRLTDVAAQFNSSVAKPAYSTIPAWNADESLLILYVTGGSNAGHFLFDGRTYQPLKALNITPADIEHFYWSSTDPDVLFYPLALDSSGTPLRQLIRYHVSTGRKEVVYDVANAGDSYRVDFGGDPIYGSYDNDLFGLRKRAGSDTGFTFRLSTKTESTRFAGDAPQVSPSGRYFLASDYVADTTSNVPIRQRKVVAHEHGSMARLANGQDIWASVQFDGNQGTLVTENLDTGAVAVVVGPSNGYPYPPSGTHISGHAFKAPGWVAVSITGDPRGQRLLDQELLLANLNDGTVCRVGHHRTAGGDGPNGYWAEPHVNISPSGTRMVFGSDWGGGSTVDTYVVELPSYAK